MTSYGAHLAECAEIERNVNEYPRAKAEEINRNPKGGPLHVMWNPIKLDEMLRGSLQNVGESLKS